MYSLVWISNTKASIRVSKNFIKKKLKNTIIFSNIVLVRNRLRYRLNCLRDIIRGIRTCFPSSFSKSSPGFFIYLSAFCVRCRDNYIRKAIDFKCLEISQCKNEKFHFRHKWLKFGFNPRDENQFVSYLNYKALRPQVTGNHNLRFCLVYIKYLYIVGFFC